MNCLTFQKFVPTSKGDKDFSGLEDAIRHSHFYAVESGDARCVFVRGSTVSSYETEIVRAHPNSDVDVVVVSPRPNRTVNQYHEALSFGQHSVEMPVDVTNLNQNSLEQEVSGRGDKGVTSLLDFVQVSHPVDHAGMYSFYRDRALVAFLRIGLGYYGTVTSVTPSGAMKAINQGMLLINPLRWWSIEYAFSTSNSAEQNKARYYDDVARMLHSTLPPQGKSGDEDLYEIPEGFVISTPLQALRAEYFFNKILGRFNSTPVFSLNDLQKARNKLKSLIVGILEGKGDIDKIFGNAE